MRHPDQLRDTSPRTRTDPTRPPRSPRSSTRRPSEGSRGPAASRPGGRYAAAAPGQALASGGPTPATVWLSRGSPSDLDAEWPLPVVVAIVISFTNPDGHVVLLPSPTPIPITPALPECDEPDGELQDALTAVRGLERTAQVIHTDPAPRTPGRATPEPNQFGDSAAGTDLVITSLRPEHGGDQASDRIALAAARLLRTGGILTVLTHSDTAQGQLVDPTGAVVAAAQNADLLYLQHIVVVHAPVRDGKFMIDNPHPRPRAQPTTHHRIHTDLLVFAQPHDHQAVPLQ